MYDDKIEQHEPHEEPGENVGAPEGDELLLHVWHPSYYSCYNPDDKS
jgi:hypothetical protein